MTFVVDIPLWALWAIGVPTALVLLLGLLISVFLIWLMASNVD